MKRLKVTSGFVGHMEELSKFEAAAAKVSRWFTLSRPQKIFRFHLWYLAYQLSKKHPRPIHARTFWGAEFHCYLPDYFLTWRYGVLGDPSELALTRFILKTVKSGDVFFDVGANCGFYTLLAGRLVGSQGAVHSFEPTPDIFSILRVNAGGINQVRVNQLAVSDKEGEARLLIDPIFSVVNSLVVQDGESSGIGVCVQTTSLDVYTEQTKAIPTFIKIDVEGAEELAISGAKRLLADHSPIVSLEILGSQNEAHVRAVSLLLGLGYRGYRLVATGEIEPVSLSAENLKSFFAEGKGFDNFIFKKN